MGSDEFVLRLELQDKILFEHCGNWLYPLFALEDWLKDKDFDRSQLLLRDKIIGKAAAVIIVRVRLRCLYGKIVSMGALQLLQHYQLTCDYQQLVPAIGCRTERLITNFAAIEQNYQMLYNRAFPSSEL